MQSPYEFIIGCIVGLIVGCFVWWLKDRKRIKSLLWYRKDWNKLYELCDAASLGQSWRKHFLAENKPGKDK